MAYYNNYPHQGVPNNQAPYTGAVGQPFIQVPPPPVNVVSGVAMQTAPLLVSPYAHGGMGHALGSNFSYQSQSQPYQSQNQAYQLQSKAYQPQNHVHQPSSHTNQALKHFIQPPSPINHPPSHTGQRPSQPPVKKPTQQEITIQLPQHETGQRVISSGRPRAIPIIAPATCKPVHSVSTGWSTRTEPVVTMSEALPARIPASISSPSSGCSTSTDQSEREDSTPSPCEETQKTVTEVIYDQFLSVLQQHGPQKPSSDLLLGEFISLKSDWRKVVMTKGSVRNFLLDCDRVELRGELLHLRGGDAHSLEEEPDETADIILNAPAPWSDAQSSVVDNVTHSLSSVTLFEEKMQHYGIQVIPSASYTESEESPDYTTPDMSPTRPTYTLSMANLPTGSGDTAPQVQTAAPICTVQDWPDSSTPDHHTDGDLDSNSDYPDTNMLEFEGQSWGLTSSEVLVEESYSEEGETTDEEEEEEEGDMCRSQWSAGWSQSTHKLDHTHSHTANGLTLSTHTATAKPQPWNNMPTEKQTSTENSTRSKKPLHALALGSTGGNARDVSNTSAFNSQHLLQNNHHIVVSDQDYKPPKDTLNAGANEFVPMNSVDFGPSVKDMVPPLQSIAPPVQSIASPIQSISPPVKSISRPVQTIISPVHGVVPPQVNSPPVIPGSHDSSQPILPQFSRVAPAPAAAPSLYRVPQPTLPHPHASQFLGQPIAMQPQKPQSHLLVMQPHSTGSSLLPQSVSAVQPQSNMSAVPLHHTMGAVPATLSTVPLHSGMGVLSSQSTRTTLQPQPHVKTAPCQSCSHAIHPHPSQYMSVVQPKAPFDIPQSHSNVAPLPTPFNITQPKAPLSTPHPEPTYRLVQSHPPPIRPMSVLPFVRAPSPKSVLSAVSPEFKPQGFVPQLPVSSSCLSAPVVCLAPSRCDQGTSPLPCMTRDCGTGTVRQATRELGTQSLQSTLSMAEVSINTTESIFDPESCLYRVETQDECVGTRHMGHSVEMSTQTNSHIPTQDTASQADSQTPTQDSSSQTDLDTLTQGSSSQADLGPQVTPAEDVYDSALETQYQALLQQMMVTLLQTNPTMMTDPKLLKRTAYQHLLTMLGKEPTVPRSTPPAPPPAPPPSQSPLMSMGASGLFNPFMGMPMMPSCLPMPNLFGMPPMFPQAPPSDSQSLMSSQSEPDIPVPAEKKLKPVSTEEESEPPASTQPSPKRPVKTKKSRTKKKSGSVQPQVESPPTDQFQPVMDTDKGFHFTEKASLTFQGASPPQEATLGDLRVPTSRPNTGPRGKLNLSGNKGNRGARSLSSSGVESGESRPGTPLQEGGGKTGEQKTGLQGTKTRQEPATRNTQITGVQATQDNQMTGTQIEQKTGMQTMPRKKSDDIQSEQKIASQTTHKTGTQNIQKSKKTAQLSTVQQSAHETDPLNHNNSNSSAHTGGAAERDGVPESWEDEADPYAPGFRLSQTAPQHITLPASGAGLDGFKRALHSAPDTGDSKQRGRLSNTSSSSEPDMPDFMPGYLKRPGGLPACTQERAHRPPGLSAQRPSARRTPPASKQPDNSWSNKGAWGKAKESPAPTGRPPLRAKTPPTKPSQADTARTHFRAPPPIPALMSLDSPSMCTLRKTTKTQQGFPSISEDSSKVSELCNIEVNSTQQDWKQVGNKKKRGRETSNPVSTVPANLIGRKMVSLVGKPEETDKKATSFEKLIGKMKEKFPALERGELLSLMNDVRAKKGSLKGIGMGVIVMEAETIMAARKAAASPLPQNTNNNSACVSPQQITLCSTIRKGKVCHKRDKCAFAHTAAEVERNKALMYKASRAPQSPNAEQLEAAGIALVGETDFDFVPSEEEPDSAECLICRNHIRTSYGTKLDCGHEFHDKCIKSWIIGQERTCPLCRKLTLLRDEFPSLGS